MATLPRTEPIPKTPAIPAVSGAKTLFSLPGEIRNKIYSYLLPAHGEIEIHQIVRDERFASADTRPIHTRHAHALKLLTTCRQVYHEATSLFLSSNTWVISRASYDKSGYRVTQADDLATWLTMLGSSSAMVQKVIVNLAENTDNGGDQLKWRLKIDSSKDTTDMAEAVKLGNLLKSLWATPNAIRAIKIVSPKGAGKNYKYRNNNDFNPMFSKTHPENRGNKTHPVFDTSAITNALIALRRDDLGLKNCGRQVHDVLIRRDGLEGYIQFDYNYYKPSHNRPHVERTYVERKFSITNGGKTLSLQPTDTPGLMNLPQHLKIRLFESLCLAKGFLDPWRSIVTIDLDQKTTVGATPVLESVSQHLRSECYYRFWLANIISVKMRSTNVETDFDHFDKLRVFCCTASTPREPWRMSNRRKGIRDLEFLLQFNISLAPKLDDLRINILDFLRVTSYLDSHDRKITFQIGDTNDKASVSLAHLRTCALIALTDFQQTYKRTRPDTKRCPNIWVNGYGRILCVEGPGGKSINPSEAIQRSVSRGDSGEDCLDPINYSAAMEDDWKKYDNLRVYFDKLPEYPAIAEGKSTPCDPTAPSFLTTLPAEVRNAIYDYLLLVPGGIRLSPQKDFVTRSTFEDEDMWSLAAAAAKLPHLKVEFVHPKRQIHYDFHPLNGALEHDIGVRLDMLSIVFQTLRKDAIGIKKYGKQIGEVFIQRDCTEGTVVFRQRRSAPMVDLVKLHFDISDEGKTFTWTSLERKPRHLLALPYHIREQILNEVSFVGRAGPCNDDPEIIWDLDQRTLTGASLISREICRELRFEFRPMLQLKQNHVLRMGTRELRADFGTFQNLQRLWSTNVSHDAPMGTYEAPIPAKFLLQFHVPPETTLEDISLNITPLLRLTQAYEGRTKITISIPGRKGIPDSETTTNLYMCRALALSEIAETKKNWCGDWFSKESQHPAVWMNGYFEPVELDLDDCPKFPTEDE
ncbi:hypothetical protein J4E81_007730 [Alternaria sp. BMP 2799]|nr:hypothetical protein J4E81_007730 [Alternaria sp. BMP 2799]